ncbi:hypothetical protein [Dapis sp. BLCC M229]|uniref:hypothetical protein n=1 Tax=Dapis sp. BLCC M229 TaxID=3400188 RepID=UPI003CF3B6C8
MNISEINYLENVKESSLVNGGLSIAYPPIFPFPLPTNTLNASASSQTFGNGYFTQATTQSTVNISPNYAQASTYGTVSTWGGTASTSSAASASSSNSSPYPYYY